MTSRPGFPGLSPAQRERLALLVEECSEVIQAATKILRHGYQSNHPDRPDTNNREDLERELGDLSAAYSLLKIAGDIDEEQVWLAGDSKWERVQQYLHHQHPLLFAGGRH